MADALAHGADVNWLNGAKESRSPLLQAVTARGADYHAKDKQQKDPIGIAVETANADIVTLLRIAKMNKEMREMEGGFGQS
ncbi:hypothetical protein CRUP_022872, partial [Coryphaenoides rupestris]